MFLDTVLTRNPGLVDAAAALHRNGEIPPDTYVVDLDAVEANAALLAAEAERLGLGLWFVVKQVGRNPELIRAVARHIPRSAAIDPAEARTLHAAGAQPGNLGHLVQIPRRALPEMLAWRPETVTVFDLANARAVSEAARELGFVQDILIRLEGAAGTVYPGQEGGVPLDRLDAFAKDAEALDGIRIAGVTAFPCVLCDPTTGMPAATPNLGLAIEARELLAARGHHGLKLSAPSATSMASLPLLAELGATHGEPGHALTGTTPLHALDPAQPEKPAYVYVSEVAHTLDDGRPAIYGGGFYNRSHIRSALLPRTGIRLGVQSAPAENIDYYRLLDAPTRAADVRVGDTALLAFRTQIFVTRSTVAVVSGLASGSPRLNGLYDAHGRAL
ncbi:MULTISPECIES: alanine racemase [unclassified Streptomyces]|uniref:alanine racemase n=1 Tax=unclassified Streptomyces TaxID=2593676 RepID=UPI0001C1BFA0|nr:MULTISPECIES: alanine racemase [unclassified Streptomyces]MYR68418.1 YhfX family PLP-dependent enzyme [Streptomyces sp. SID4939]MYS02122.1 YhfX family PLP-dependent enzyme [Streptomyces sp. SID4940]MYT66773.1 YhfX family PLP-dependent enzyme [Streptomyces sp. SID8357]MYT83694.1 YhfX family PLP-dependent enzyme [Streptomyces sp. SID8360]MYW35575.1 YhfX family PLP-dependent enzyme [Streptomyces sp. SID1]